MSEAQKRRSMIVTGGNNGLGFQCARFIGSEDPDAMAVLACRNVTAGNRGEGRTEEEGDCRRRSAARPRVARIGQGLDDLHVPALAARQVSSAMRDCRMSGRRSEPSTASRRRSPSTISAISCSPTCCCPTSSRTAASPLSPAAPRQPRREVGHARAEIRDRQRGRPRFRTGRRGRQGPLRDFEALQPLLHL